MNILLNHSLIKSNASLQISCQWIWGCWLLRLGIGSLVNGLLFNLFLFDIKSCQMEDSKPNRKYLRKSRKSTISTQGHRHGVVFVLRVVCSHPGIDTREPLVMANLVSIILRWLLLSASWSAPTIIAFWVMNLDINTHDLLPLRTRSHAETEAPRYVLTSLSLSTRLPKSSVGYLLHRVALPILDHTCSKWSCSLRSWRSSPSWTIGLNYS